VLRRGGEGDRRWVKKLTDHPDRRQCMFLGTNISHCLQQDPIKGGRGDRTERRKGRGGEGKRTAFVRKADNAVITANKQHC